MRIFTFFQVCLLLLGALLPERGRAQTYQLPAYGTASYTTCTGTLYDDGGATGPYALNATGAVTLLPATPGNKIQLSFSQLQLGSTSDRLVVYDGPSLNAPVLAVYVASSAPGGTVYASTSSGALTVQLAAGGGPGGSGFAATIACVATVPLPDLSVRNASASVTQVLPGTSFFVSGELVNLSGGLAPSVRLNFYYSDDNVLSNNDVLLDWRLSVSPLPAGSGSWQSGTLKLPPGTTPGTRYVLLVADPDNQVPESNEANNVAAVALLVPATVPDLTTQVDYLYPNPATPGAQLTFSCRLSNQGGGAAGPAPVAFYFSADSLLGSGDLLLYTNRSQPVLTAGSSTTLYGDGTLPASTAPGRYYLLAVADPSNEVAESNEDNNLSFKRLRVNPAAIDLAMLTQPLLAQPGTAAAGNRVEVTCAVQNQGNITANPVAVGIYFSTNTTFDAADVPLASQALGALYSGQTVGVQRTGTIPAGTTPGSYYLLAVADPQQQLADVNRANNVQAIPFTVTLPNVDLLVAGAVSGNPTPRPGDYFVINSDLRNAGTTAAMPASLGVYYSDDDRFDANDQLTSASSSASLAGNSLETFAISFTLTVTARPGRRYLLLVADYRNEVAETNENNNVYALPIDVQPPAVDLLITAGPTLASAPFSPGQVYTATSTVANAGLSKSATDRVGYYLSTDATLDASDVCLNPNPPTLSYSQLLPGSASNHSEPLLLPAGTTPGPYYLLAVADDRNEQVETNENNNVASLAIVVRGPVPDLAATAGTLGSASVPAGTTVVATATLSNLGNAPATQSPLGFYLSANTTFEPTDVLLANSPGGPLYPGQQEVRTANLTVPAATAPGSYYVLRVADPLNVVAEADETNNVGYLPLAVTAAYAGLVVPQTGVATATRCGGTVTDSGGPADYPNNSRGTLTIQPGTAGGRVQLTFTLFDTELGADYLQVYDGTNAAAPLLATYTGSQLPPPVAASTANSSGALTLVFVSDNSSVGAGFEATISCQQPLAAAGALPANSFSVAPNPVPAGAPLRVHLGSLPAGTTTLTLHNSLGQLVTTRTLPATPPTETELPTASLAPGVYVLRLRTADGQQAVRRVAVE